MSSQGQVSNEDAKRIAGLISRISVVRTACDLDLLVFLHRHPRALLTSEQLAAFIGYDFRQIAQSLDAFINAGILERTQNPTHAARMYLLVLRGPNGGGDLLELFTVASTRPGRRAILKALSQTRPEAKDRVILLRPQLVRSA